MRRPVPLLLTGLTILTLACSGCAAAPRSQQGDGAGATTTGSSGVGAAPVAVFLGDSYTAASDHGGGYALRAAGELGWTPVLEAVSGTGYVTAGQSPGGAPYADRLAAVVADDPDVVVVQGSTNDVGSPLAAVGDAAEALYASLRGRLPGTEVLVLGPTSPPGVDPAALLAVRNALRGAALRAGLRFIDPVAEGWLAPPEGLYADSIHPNETGYRELAEDLVTAVRGGG